MSSQITRQCRKCNSPMFPCRTSPLRVVFCMLFIDEYCNKCMIRAADPKLFPRYISMSTTCKICYETISYEYGSNSKVDDMDKETFIAVHALHIYGKVIDNFKHHYTASAAKGFSGDHANSNMEINVYYRMKSSANVKELQRNDNVPNKDAWKLSTSKLHRLYITSIMKYEGRTIYKEELSSFCRKSLTALGLTYSDKYDANLSDTMFNIVNTSTFRCIICDVIYADLSDDVIINHFNACMERNMETIKSTKYDERWFHITDNKVTRKVTRNLSPQDITETETTQ